MAESTTKPERRAFRMDPALLWSVIESQAGSAEKALLEAIVNYPGLKPKFEQRCLSLVDQTKKGVIFSTLQLRRKDQPTDASSVCGS